MEGSVSRPFGGIEEAQEDMEAAESWTGMMDSSPNSSPLMDPDSLEATLGPPLEFLPKDIEPTELQAYRSDYQAFRVGLAKGARGEIGSVCSSRQVSSGMDDEDGECVRSTIARRGARCSRRRSMRLVPLIDLKLAASSASRSAMSAASEHHQEQDFLDLLADECELGAAGPAPGICVRAAAAAAVEVAAALSPTVSLGAAGPRISPRRVSSPLATTSPQATPPRSAPSRPPAASAETAVPEVTLPSSMPPLNRGTNASAVTSQQGVGLLVHIIISLACLLPCLLKPGPRRWPQSLGLPAGYVLAIAAVALTREQDRPTCVSPSAAKLGINRLLARALRMERLVREGCVPHWFPVLSASIYGLIATSLTLARTVGSGARRISLWSGNVQRHDYSCWGSEMEDVADCVLVRHAACTVLMSFYTCLGVMAVCNRNVKGLAFVFMHRESLLELFPLEAPCLFSYVDRSVESNSTFWRTNRRYLLQSVSMSFAWTLISFGVYAGLLWDAKRLVSQVVFLAAVPATYVLQFTLLRHVLLRVLLHLEAVKARAAAMAYCDEEGVLPFTSAHAVYVWFCVRRNMQAQNEVEYQHATPIFAASALSAAALSLWVASQVSRRGLSVFALTSQGGASLMCVASACFSCVFVAVFLGTLMDIGKLEEAHARQLRVAHLRLEHARNQQLKDGEVSEANELEGAAAMIEKVILFLEQHDPKASVFGVEIGSKSFQVVYAALLSNAWYLLVWGVLIPVMSSDGGGSTSGDE